MSEVSTLWLEYIKERLKNNDTIIFRELEVAEGIINIIYDTSSCERTIVSDFIISPILSSTKSFTDIEIIKREVLQIASVEDVQDKENAVDFIISGEVVILFGFLNKAITCHSSSYPKRAIDTTVTETVIKGPRAGFNESIADSIALIKARIKDPNLKFENFMIGEKSKTKVSLIYIEGNAPTQLVNYVREKIKNVTTDYMIYLNHIEEELKC